MTPTRSDDAALDRLLRPRLVVDPPAEVQARLLAAAMDLADPQLATIGAAASSTVSGRRRLPLLGYALVGLAFGLYSALLGGLGLAAAPEELAQRSVQVAAIALGSPVRWVLAAILEQAADQAIWLLLAPLAWYLWESDRAPARQM